MSDLARPDWFDDAACADMGPRAFDVFFPNDVIGPKGRKRKPRTHPDYAEALNICRSCPVQDECRRFGAGEPFGVWGGTVVGERNARRRTCLACRDIFLDYSTGGRAWYCGEDCRREGKNDRQYRYHRRTA